MNKVHTNTVVFITKATVYVSIHLCAFRWNSNDPRNLLSSMVGAHSARTGEQIIIKHAKEPVDEGNFIEPRNAETCFWRRSFSHLPEQRLFEPPQYYSCRVLWRYVSHAGGVLKWWMTCALSCSKDRRRSNLTRNTEFITWINRKEGTVKGRFFPFIISVAAFLILSQGYNVVVSCLSDR